MCNAKIYDLFYVFGVHFKKFNNFFLPSTRIFNIFRISIFDWVSEHPEMVEVSLPEFGLTYPTPTYPDEYLVHSVGDNMSSVMTETTTCTGLSPRTITEVEIVQNNNEEDFDVEMLRELGDAEKDPVDFGDDLQTDVAARLQKILLEGLKKDTKEELLKKYAYPKNVPLSRAPTLNPEIGAMLADTCKQRDKRLLTKQDQLGKALTALGKALTGLLKKTPDIPDVIRTLNDAGRLLADSHYAETDTRRSVIIPLIDKSLAEPFKDRKRDHLLFGEKLGDLVKDSQGIKKTGQMIQPTASNLNGKGPSQRGARQQRGGQTYHHRAGGPRTAPAYPHYTYPHPGRHRYPPPPPARRQQGTTALPPPPPRATTRRAPAPAAPRSANNR